MNDHPAEHDKGVLSVYSGGREWRAELTSFVFTDDQFAKVLRSFDDGAFIYPDRHEWRIFFEDDLFWSLAWQKARPIGRHPRGRPSVEVLNAKYLTRGLARYFKLATGQPAGGSCVTATGGPFCRFARTVFKIVRPGRPPPTPRTILRHLASGR